MNPTRRMTWATAWLLPLWVALPSVAQEKGPNLAELAKAGQATLKRLETQAASWSATTHLAGDVRAIVDIVVMPGMRRSVLSLDAEGRRSEVLRIIAREGVWYVTEGRKAGKYRPYEAPFDLPTAYYFLERAEPRCIDQPAGVDLGTYERAEGGIATYRTSLTGPMQEQLRNLLRYYDDITRRDAERAAKPALAESARLAREILTKGVPVKIQVATGMMIQFGAATRQTELRDFRWLDRVDPQEFRVEGKRWEDFTDDPTEGDTSELVMIAHSGIWSPGQRAGDTDGRLLDLRTGRYRRIPFQGATCQTGCFLKGRKRVVISGLNSVAGTMGLYEVDLKTGENRRLGGELLANGFTLMPSLSPDGTLVAALHKGAAEGALDTQVCLVDLKTGDARALGKPRDMAAASWLPDGKGLLFLVREANDPSDPRSPKNETIARMDMEGHLTKIRDGGSPVLLNDGKTVLFRDTKSRAWQTCGLDGRDVKPFGGGLTEYGFPTPAPDGKRILMMHFRPGGAPEPTILRIGEDKGKPVVTASGLWAAPAWR